MTSQQQDDERTPLVRSPTSPSNVGIYDSSSGRGMSTNTDKTPTTSSNRRTVGRRASAPPSSFNRRFASTQMFFVSFNQVYLHCIYVVLTS